MSEATCQICGWALGREPCETCASCFTPHHADCWMYFGGCSTYGCRATEVVRPGAVATRPQSLLVIEGDDEELDDVVWSLPNLVAPVPSLPLRPLSVCGHVLHFNERGLAHVGSSDQPAVQVDAGGQIMSMHLARRRAPAIVATSLSFSLLGAIAAIPQLMVLSLLGGGFAAMCCARFSPEATWVRRLPSGQLALEAVFREGRDVFHRAGPWSLPRRPHRVRLVSRYLTDFENVLQRPTVLTARCFFLELALGVRDSLIIGAAENVLLLAPVIHKPQHEGQKGAFVRALRTLRETGVQVASALDIPYMEAPWSRVSETQARPESGRP